MKKVSELLNRPWAGLIAAVALAGLWSGALWYFRPARLFNGEFIYYEQGNNLHVTDQLLAGKRLYRDAFSPYGPIPAYAQAAWAACFGNTARTYVGLMLGLTLVVTGLVFLLLRRRVPGPLALGWLAVAVLPYLLLPGSFNAPSMASVYPGFERIFLLLIALLWVDPRGRSGRRACLLGVLLGGMQGVKFGGAFMAGGALAATDALALWQGRADRATWRRCVRGWLWTLAGFLGMEALWVGAALLALPVGIARDVLWPSYMLKNYASYAAVVPHYLAWVGWKYALEAQLPVGLAAILNAGLIWRVLTRRGNGGECREGPLVFCALYFPLALALYLPHVWVAVVSTWIFLVAGAEVFAGLTWRVRTLVLVGLLPCGWVSVRSVLPFREDRTATEDVALPNGEHLWLTPHEKARVARIQETVEKLARGRPPVLMIFTIGSGWYHFYPDRHFTRHTYMSPGLVRPDEEPGLVASLAATDAVVICLRDKLRGPVGPNPATWQVLLNPGFAPATNAAFARRLGEPIPIDECSVVFPVRH